jgi:hypothetical protein
MAYRNTADGKGFTPWTFQKEIPVFAGVEKYFGKICVYGNH